MPRPSVAGDGEFLEVDGERYGVVSSFCYLGDMLDGTWWWRSRGYARWYMVVEEQRQLRSCNSYPQWMEEIRS